MYAIKNSNGYWVSSKSKMSTFTKDVKYARKFDSKEEAQKECASDQHPVNLNMVNIR